MPEQEINSSHCRDASTTARALEPEATMMMKIVMENNISFPFNKGKVEWTMLYKNWEVWAKIYLS